MTIYDNNVTKPINGTWQVLTIGRLQIRNNVRIEEICHIHQLTGLCDPMLQTYKTSPVRKITRLVPTELDLQTERTTHHLKVSNLLRTLQSFPP